MRPQPLKFLVYKATPTFYIYIAQVSGPVGTEAASQSPGNSALTEIGIQHNLMEFTKNNQWSMSESSLGEYNPVRKSFDTTYITGCK